MIKTVKDLIKYLSIQDPRAKVFFRKSEGDGYYSDSFMVAWPAPGEVIFQAIAFSDEQSELAAKEASKECR
jgi:hypothetical protein